MDTTKTTTHIGLCAGYGGIELGLKRVIPNLRSVALCEIEAFACANLVAKMEAGLMEPAPIWTDLKSFPWESFRDRVDILTGGYPCQPFSAVGKRLGTEDPRHLWPYIASGIRVLRPKLCFFENVEGHISLGLREVIGGLESMGYTASWGIFSAREVGAPHQRKRVFIMAVSNSIGGAAGLSRSLAWNEGIAGEFDHGSGEGCRELADDTSERLPLSDGQRNEPAGQRDAEFECRSHIAWPSRPGEPQHAWEPPRVVGGSVANSNSNEPSEGRGDNAEVLEVSSEQWKDECSTISGGESEFSGEEVLGNASSERSGTLGTEPAVQQWQASIASTSDAMGNASQREDHGRESRDLGLAPSQGGSSNDAADCTSEDGGLADSLQRRSDGWSNGIGGRIGQPSEDEATNGRRDECKIEPSLGRDSDGPAGGMDYAELYTTCDNRTDELRLLGNGVVPATAERAFRTLLSELNT